MPSLDSSLYPLAWQPNHANEQSSLSSAQYNQRPLVFEDAHALLMALLNEQIAPEPQRYWQLLHDNEVYQEWINFIVFGRYVQRSFTAFYRQSADHFNSGMPELLRHELLRYAQYLPRQQTLFFAGSLPTQVRQEKLLTLTLNPCTAVKDAREIQQHSRSPAIVINQVITTGEKVTAFAIRPNKRTSERLRCEVMVLDFQELRLVKEQEIDDLSLYHDHPDNCPVVLRHYQLR